MGVGDGRRPRGPVGLAWAGPLGFEVALLGLMTAPAHHYVEVRC